MGANPWWYIVDYKPDIDSALQSLRQQEFQAGRYFPAISYESFPLNPDYSSSAQHESIEAAIEAADADGTQSILDIRAISEDREAGTASPLEPFELLNIFGTETPTIDTVDDEEIPEEIFSCINRGEAVYVILYKDNNPNKLMFVGYSYD
jgi:hypothetical protein